MPTSKSVVNYANRLTQKICNLPSMRMVCGLAERYAHLKQERLQESAGFAGKTFAHILNTPDPIIVPSGMAAPLLSAD